jgi:hypothetical protein
MLTSATLRNHWPLLAFGWLMTFGSAFGQTYFISIFGGVIREELALIPRCIRVKLYPGR